MIAELREKLDRLRDMYTEMREEALRRGDALERTAGVSDKFWDDVTGLLATLRDLQVSARAQKHLLMLNHVSCVA